MKIECPKCNAVGKVKEEQLPSGGANIRCPSCAHIFFVPGPERKSGDFEGVSASTPSPEVVEATRSMTGANVAISAPSGEGLDERKVNATVRESAIPESAPAREATGSHESAAAGPSTGATRKRSRKASWKVRAAGGMVYDFSDTDGLRQWLESRPSWDGLEASDDAGQAWRQIAGWDDFSDLKPTGMRTSQTGAIKLNRSTTKIPSVGPETGAASAEFRTTGSVPKQDEPVTAPKVTAITGAVKKADTKAVKVSPEPGEKKKSGLAVRVVLYSLLFAALAAGVVYLKKAGEPAGIPDTPAGNQVAWILEQLNGNSVNLTDNDIATRFSVTAIQTAGASELIRNLRYWDDRNAGYNYVGVEGRSTDHLLKARVITFEGTDGYITVETEPTPPHRIATLNFTAAN